MFQLLEILNNLRKKKSIRPTRWSLKVCFQSQTDTSCIEDFLRRLWLVNVNDVTAVVSLQFRFSVCFLHQRQTCIS